MKNTYPWLDTARKLQAIAQTGLEYCENEFDRDRYRQIREISLEIMEKLTEYELSEIVPFFSSADGYPTPKVDVRAAIFREDTILMVREKMDGRWSLPGGWADQHLSLRENVIKESKEEAGVDVEPVSIVAIHDRDIRNYPPLPHGCYKIFVECTLLGGRFEENPEISSAGYFRFKELPPLSTERITEDQIRMCFEHRGRKLPTEFD